jgi:hypothetical protein
MNQPSIVNPLQRRVFDAINHYSKHTSTGLAFVPSVIDKLDDEDPEQVRQVLLQLDREQLIELRPDGGLGRFTSRELAGCPEGPQGSRLLWIRITGTPLPP